MLEERIISIIDRINRLGGYVPEPVEPPPVVKPPSPSHLPSRAWSPEDDDKLRTYWLSHSNARLAGMFGRTSGAIRKRARRLGLPRKDEVCHAA